MDRLDSFGERSLPAAAKLSAWPDDIAQPYRPPQPQPTTSASTADLYNYYERTPELATSAYSSPVGPQIYIQIFNQPDLVQSRHNQVDGPPGFSQQCYAQGLAQAQRAYQQDFAQLGYGEAGYRQRFAEPYGSNYQWHDPHPIINRLERALGMGPYAAAYPAYGIYDPTGYPGLPVAQEGYRGCYPGNYRQSAYQANNPYSGAAGFMTPAIMPACGMYGYPRIGYPYANMYNSPGNFLLGEMTGLLLGTMHRRRH